MLVAQEDITIREPLLQATALGQVDFYVGKPWRSPDEPFHGLVTEFLDEWTMVHRPGFVALRVVGARWSERSHEIRDLRDGPHSEDSVEESQVEMARERAQERAEDLGKRLDEPLESPTRG